MSRLFGSAVHSCYVVPDVQAAMQEFLDQGFGPFFVMDHITPDARHRGNRNNPCLTAVFFNSGDMQIELIEPHGDTPSAYKEFLERSQQGGLHHIAYWVDDLQDALRDAAAQGFEYNTVQEFIYPDGTPFEIYVERADKPDTLLIQLMIDSPVRAFFNHVRRAAEGWDGQEPFRDALKVLGAEMELKPV